MIPCTRDCRRTPDLARAAPLTGQHTTGPQWQTLSMTSTPCGARAEQTAPPRDDRRGGPDDGGAARGPSAALIRIAPEQS
ncbi:MAG: hypothetical protein MZV64_74185 [Ignavibacteriales bacterium]|nr:hypothetical protein [Ignavibacteriales bacterium]